MANSNPHYAGTTQSSSEDPIFGTYLQQLPHSRLPTMTDIYRHFLYLRESEDHISYMRNGKIVKSLTQPARNRIVTNITQELKNIWWNEASIPVREDKNINRDVANLVQQGSEFIKEISQVKEIGREEFLKRKGFTKVLDISKCR